MFNGGLILAGVLALPFCLPLARASSNAAHWLGILAFGVTAVSLALVGVFALPAPAHGPVAITFFLSFTVALLARGTGDLLSGARERGLTTVGFGLAHVAAWVVWGATGVTTGLAVPEYVGAALLSSWLAVTGLRFARR